MRSIKRRFQLVTKKQPELSSFICFAQTVKKQRFSRKTINHWFNRLIDVDDYLKADKRKLVSHMLFLSFMSDESIKRDIKSL